MSKIDYKKTQSTLYMPKTTPSFVTVPKMKFFCIEGRGNPNIEDGDYKKAVSTLFGLSYAVKMSPKNGIVPDGYFDYVVPPLEGLWWTPEIPETGKTIIDKDTFQWLSMIRQPEFVTEDLFYYALEILHKKQPDADLTVPTLKEITEGECVQVMHHGPYDDEPITVEKMKSFIKENGYVNDIGTVTSDGFLRRHHEIYLKVSDGPRSVSPDKMKTVIRIPVSRAIR